MAVSQEVVKLDLVEREISTHAMMEQNVSHLASSDSSHFAAEIECGDSRICLFNGSDASVIQNTFQCIGGMPHAW